ncbi:MAG: T9SS type A sorting domain-containing protein [FCB group bacterium]|nr:T9SS type A sorting domain-containing protein [FCB group bacterium]
MKKMLNTVLLIGTFVSMMFAVNITFQVDMSLQEISPNGVHIAGSFQGWNPGASEMLPVEEGSMIYAATFELTPAEEVFYKFINSNDWDGGQEGLDRSYVVPDVDTVVEAVCFNMDTPCPTATDPSYVTFNLSTSSSPGFIPEENTIVVRGTFNGWGGNDWVVEYQGNELWTLTSPEPIAVGNHAFKFVHLAIAGDEWEGISDRPFTVSGDGLPIDLPLAFWNTDMPPVVTTDGLDVFLRVCTLGIPGYAGETMYVAGTFTDWGTNPIELIDQFGDQTFWYTNVVIPEPERVGIMYKFWWDWEGWENISDRSAEITEDTIMDFVYYNDIPPLDIDPVTKTVVFSVDMTEWLDEPGASGMPIFSLARLDEIQVRGGFNGWNATPPEEAVMVNQPGTNIFTLPVTIVNYPDQVIEYKYFINHSEQSILFLEGIYGPFYNVDQGWEDSPQFGGGNRTFTLGAIEDGEILQLPLAGYYDLPSGAVVPEGQSVTQTFTVDMSGVDEFDPAYSVVLILKDKWTNYVQSFGYGNGDGSRWVAEDIGGGLYQATVTLQGPAPWHQIYTWEYVDLDQTNVQEGGGFAFGRFRARYMCPVDGVWEDFAFPTDIFTMDPPLLVEPFEDALSCLGVCLSNGDVAPFGGDGNTDVLDIVGIVAHILGTNVLADEIVCHADMDSNGSIDILDIVIVIDLILGSNREDSATSAVLNTEDGVVSLSADGVVGGVYMSLSHGADFSITLTEDAYLSDSYTADGVTTLVVLRPAGELFTADGEFVIDEITAATGYGYVDVSIAENYALLSSYPNPFNPTTRIDYNLPSEGLVNVSIYNMLGQNIATLVNENMVEGSYSVVWNTEGASIPSGIYLVKLDHSEGSVTQKITLLK